MYNQIFIDKQEVIKHKLQLRADVMEKVFTEGRLKLATVYYMNYVNSKNNAYIVLFIDIIGKTFMPVMMLEKKKCKFADKDIVKNTTAAMKKCSIPQCLIKKVLDEALEFADLYIYKGYRITAPFACTVKKPTDNVQNVPHKKPMQKKPATGFKTTVFSKPTTPATNTTVAKKPIAKPTMSTATKPVTKPMISTNTIADVAKITPAKTTKTVKPAAATKTAVKPAVKKETVVKPAATAIKTTEVKSTVKKTTKTVAKEPVQETKETPVVEPVSTAPPTIKRAAAKKVIKKAPTSSSSPMMSRSDSRR